MVLVSHYLGALEFDVQDDFKAWGWAQAVDLIIFKADELQSPEARPLTKDFQAKQFPLIIGAFAAAHERGEFRNEGKQVSVKTSGGS